MLVGPRAILISVNVEHGANASPRQQREFALSARVFPAKIGVTEAGRTPASTTRYGDEK